MQLLLSLGRGPYIAARAVDVQVDVLLVLRIQVQHGGHQLVSQLLIYGLPQKDDPLPVLQPRATATLAGQSLECNLCSAVKSGWFKS